MAGENLSLSISKWRLGEEGNACDGELVIKEEYCGTNEAKKTPYSAAAYGYSAEGKPIFATFGVQGPSWNIRCFIGTSEGENNGTLNCTYSGIHGLAGLGLGEGLYGEVTENGTVLSFKPNELSQSGTCWGGEEPELSGSYEIVEPSGHMYVSTVEPPAVTTGKATHVHATYAVLNGTVNPKGNSATSYWFEYGTTTSYGSKTSTSSAGSGTSDVAVSTTIGSLTADTTYHYRLVAESESGLRSNGKDMTVGPPVYRSSFGSGGFEEDQFVRPAGIVVDPSGDIWVAESALNRIEKWSPSGEFLFAFGGKEVIENEFEEEEFIEGPLSSPSAIALDSEGNLWVADTGNSRIAEFSEDGEFLLAIGEGQLTSPEGIAIDPEGHIWVADSSEKVLKEFNTKGGVLRTFSGFQAPAGVAVGPAVGWGGKFIVYVADRGGNRVYQYLSASWFEGGKPSFLSKWGASGSGNGQFEHPDALATDSEGNVWVVDEGNVRVQEFTEEGGYITKFASKGMFAPPSGIATDSDGNIWVSDASEYRVDRWSR
jgi:sugar lactone lactonase YvrE